MNNDLNNIYGVNNDSTLDPTRESNPTIEPTPMPAVEPNSVPAMGPTPVQTAEPVSMSAMGPTPVQTAEPASVQTMGPTPVQTVEPVSMSAMGPTPVQTAEPASVQTMGPTSMPEINLNKEDIMEEALSHTNQYSPFEAPKQEVNMEVKKSNNKGAYILIAIIMLVMLLFIIFLPQISKLFGW